MEFPQVDEPEPADTSLGRLQRGRGAGWREAVGSESGEQWLLACLTHEPRWDPQLEPRVDYYATLAMRLQVPTSLFASGPSDEEYSWIVRGVVEAMARRGSIDAAELLRTTRRDDDDEGAHRRPSGRRSPRVQRASAHAPIEELLAASGPRPYPRAVIHRLRTTRDPVEVDALRRVAQEVDGPGWHLAVHVLGRRGDASPLDVVERVLITDETGSVRASAFGFVTALPAEISLPLARSWLLYDDGRGSVASSVMADHAEPVDAAVLRTALTAADDYYSISSLVQALGRLPEEGPFPELDEVYVQAAYSYARARTVEAMAVTDPAFVDKWAAECLWDCEGSVRSLGARMARTDAVVIERLRELADDEFEVDEVRGTARVRLGHRAATERSSRRGTSSV